MSPMIQISGSPPPPVQAAGSATSAPAPASITALKDAVTIDRLLASEDHLNFLLIRVVAAVKLLQLLIWPVGLIFGLGVGLRNFPLAVGVYVVLASWALIWGTLMLSRRSVAHWQLYCDVAISFLAVTIAGAACYPWDSLSWANPAVAPVLGSALAASAFLPALRAVMVNLVLALGLGLAAIAGLTTVPLLSTTLAASILLLLTIAALTIVVTRHLRRQSTTQMSAGYELQAAFILQQTSKEDEAERSRQYRTLHDTVLSTLSALARGSLDARDRAVQDRCAADAEYLRSIISSTAVSAANRLQGELAGVGRDQAVLGIKVHQHVADLPAVLPDSVVDALRDATREALNNVAKHSGSSQAWVTGLGDADNPTAVSVTITDRGKGFDPTNISLGMGLRDSIGARMKEVGGSYVIDSSPGQGASVELRWPA